MPDKDLSKDILTDGQNSVLTEEVTTGGTATLPGKETYTATGLEPKAATLAAAATQEYLAGGANDPLFAYARALPSYFDDISRDFGADIYERMSLDPHIAGEVIAYKLSVLANGVRLTPALDGKALEEGADGYQKATEVRDLCEATLNELETPLDTVLENMLDAFGQGHKVAEVVYRYDSKKRLMLHRLKVKPREVIAFVVDNRWNVLGFLGALAGRSDVVLRQSIIVDPATTPNLLPRVKFACMTFRPVNSDPRGTSALRPAYNPWWLKQQTLSELAKYIAQFAGAAVVGKTAPDAKPQQMVNPDGTLAFDSAGNPVMTDPTTQLLNAVLAWRNGQALVAAHGTEIETIVADGAGAPFFSAIDLYDRQMSKAILSQSLATNESEHQTRAATGSQKDVMDLLIEGGEKACARMIRQDLLRPFVLLNFGEEMLRFLPLVSLSAVEEADFGELATATASLKTSGFLYPNQEAALSTKMGLPVGEGERASDAATEQQQEETPGKKPAAKPAKETKNDAKNDKA